MSLSDAEGRGTDVCPDGAPKVGFGDGRSKIGLAIDSVTEGDEKEEGVDACSVASRSGAGADERVKKLHPIRTISVISIPKIFVLLIIQFNRLKVELFA